MFMFLVGLSAGGLSSRALRACSAWRVSAAYRRSPCGPPICCTVLAIGFVVIDLGQPLRLWELFVYSNLGSPLMWDIIVLGTYLILSIVYLWAMLRFEGGKGSAAALRVVSAIALVCAVLVHSVTAWIFGLQQGREMWHTALLGPWFVSSALVCGVALVLVVVISAAQGWLPGARAGARRQDAQAPRGVRDGGFVLLWLRLADRGLPGRIGGRRSSPC